MIRYSELLADDFLSPSLCKELTEIGIDMSDALYSIWRNDGTYYLTEQEAFRGILKDEGMEFICKTYSLNGVIDKLCSYIDKVDGFDSNSLIKFLVNDVGRHFCIYQNDNIGKCTICDGNTKIEAVALLLKIFYERSKNI